MNDKIDGRFNFNADIVRIKNEKGEYLDGKAAIEYLKQRKEKLNVVKEKLEIGDIVKLRGFDDQLTVVINEGEDFKYGGIIDGNKINIIKFDQEDIEEFVRRR